MSLIEIKRGDTLRLECTAQERGAVVDLTGWGIACQLNGPSGAVHVFAPALVDAAAGRYDLSAEPAETRTWPVGALVADIQYTDSSGRVMSTRTFTINCLADETP